jgi:NAD(P)H dehydrogenase (quinone)
MKHVVIFAHPNAQSFTGSVAEVYANAVRALGHTVIMRDLYRIGFDPCLKPSEIPSDKVFGPAPDVVAERALLKDAEVFALVYPLWLYAPPAIMKGYMERVFGFGFAYGAEGHSYNPLLSGRKLISFSSSGSPFAWVQKTGAFDAIHTLFDRYFADLCGMTLLEHVHVGPMHPGASDVYVHARLSEVEATVRRHFAGTT